MDFFFQDNNIYNIIFFMNFQVSRYKIKKDASQYSNPQRNACFCPTPNPEVCTMKFLKKGSEKKRPDPAHGVASQIVTGSVLPVVT